MKKQNLIGIVFLAAFLSFFFFEGYSQNLVEIYKKGAVKLVPETNYAQGNDWNQVFRSYYDKMYDTYIGKRKYVTVLSDGSVVVSHSYVDYYTLFDKDGNFVREFSISTGKNKKLQKPIAGALNDKILYTKSDNMGKIHFVDLQGNVKKIVTVKYSVYDILPLPGDRLLVTGFVVGKKSRDIVSIVDYNTGDQKVIYSYWWEDGRYSTSSAGEDVPFFYRKKLENGSEIMVGYHPADAVMPVGVRQSSIRARIAIVKQKIVVAAPSVNQVITYDLNGIELSRMSIPFGKKEVSVEEQKEILRKQIESTKNNTDPTIIPNVSMNVESEEYKKVIKPELVKKMEKDMALITEPVTLPVFTTVIKDSEDNLLFFEIPETKGGNKFNVWVYQDGGNFVCQSSFVCDDYDLVINADRMAFHNGYLYSVQDKKGTKGIPMRLVKFRLSK
ncbi:MAG: hypothetical protein J6P65_01275 [Bacteroidales bacterium]|nr:hypothetical protein [Bacteroidales bacterium]